MQVIAGGGGFEPEQNFSRSYQGAPTRLRPWRSTTPPAEGRRARAQLGSCPMVRSAARPPTVFGLWTEPKPKTGRPLCQCGWSGLPHYRTTGLGLAAGGDRQAVPGVDARRECGAAPLRPRRGCGPAKARGATYPRGAVGAGRSADRRASRAVTTLSFKMAQKVGDY